MHRIAMFTLLFSLTLFAGCARPQPLPGRWQALC